ncbi:facilitated trehalose transporter Tret1-2 homolog [Bombyx mandarina]|uniref:Facilitated trehalose transporter Tret1-2 homolog n=1 Tax=Bombyx mandarina TaxID=7092 RepID=A0A6J2KNI1_BOMMA|nr:facilitated trehalose transporter Tret1-2 homolog [Bombyx mandarina]
MQQGDKQYPGFWTRTSLIQFGYGIWVNLTAMSIGLCYGFSAVQIPQLNAKDSDIHPSLFEDSLVASILTLAAPIGCVLCGYLADTIGRRKVLALTKLPLALGWLFTGFARNPIQIILGRLILGIGCGMAMSSPRVYVTEICLPNMRGVVAAMPNLFVAVGITIQAALGSVFKWRKLCYICGTYSVVMLIANFFLPETPYFVLMKDTEDKAKKSLTRFRGRDYDIDAEMVQIIEFKSANNIEKLNFRELIRALFKPSSCKPFFVIFSYFVAMQFAGVTILMMWTIEVLKASKTSLDPRYGNIILGFTRLSTACLTTVLLFKVGRKPLALVSAIGVGIISVFLGMYIHYATRPTILPQLCFMAYMVFATFGYYTIPFVVMCELFPLQVRGLLGGLSLSSFNILMFLATFCFPYLRDSLGFAFTVLMFGIISLLSAVFLYYFLPETKGLTLREIEEYFKSGRSVRQSQTKLPALMKDAANKSATLLNKLKINK